MDFDLNKRYCYYFNEIAKIPHGSKNEKALSDYIVSVAKIHGYDVKQDYVYNVIVNIPASKECENSPALIIQAHMDMVTEKTSETDHDFDKDPLNLYVEDGWLKAKGTTLGADDGMGVAYMLALMDEENLNHPPLQLIFTTMEEIGLLGAMELKKEDIHAKRMISLDGGGEVVTTVTSAGGMSIKLHKDYKLEQASGYSYLFEVKGLQGGHSGSMIDKERYNANNLAARILKELKDCTLVSWHGGRQDNAITHENKIIFNSNKKFKELNEKLNKIVENIKNELKPSEHEFYVEFKEINSVNEQMDNQSSNDIITYLWLMPHGFRHKHMMVEGLTSASENLGIVNIENGKFDGLILARSCFDSSLEDMANELKELGKLLNIKVNIEYSYSGWAYDNESKMRDIYREVCDKHEKEFVSVATHGGLECGVFKGLEPDLDIITMGAIHEDIHSPKERLDLESFDRTWILLKEIIEKCTEK